MSRFVIFAALIALFVLSPAFCQEAAAAAEQNVQAQPAQCMAAGKHHCEGLKGLLFLWILTCIIVHILTAIWVFQDIQHRHVGSGLWVILALLTGLCGTLVYAIVRIGDTPRTTVV